MFEYTENKTRCIAALIAYAFLVGLSPDGRPMPASASVRLEEMRQPGFEPLASQCGFEAIYLVLKATGHDVNLSDLISDYIDNETVEINGLSIGEICAILERHGMHCEAGPISHDAFRKFPFKKHFLIVVMRGNRNHFEVILDGTDDKVLLGMHGKDRVKWVQRDALWGEMDGPAIVVDKNRRWAALDSYSLVVLGGTIMLLPIIRAVYIRFRPTRKTSV